MAEEATTSVELPARRRRPPEHPPAPTRTPLHLRGADYRLSAAIAWVVSVLNNFWLNRHWTFRVRHAHPVRQGVRFFTISLLVFGFSYLVLIGLVEGAGMTKVLAQAIAVAAGTPLNFVGQKLWSFRA